jgi:FKBP-type peptidyl-prolyl cis-trans isomerase FkpA
MVNRLPIVRVFRAALTAACVVAAAACNNSDSTATATAPTSSSPYVQTDIVVGTGATANSGNRVTVAYTGWLYDTSKPDNKGTQFDTNASFLFTLGNGSVIKGWDQGVVGMKIGGQRRLIIPPELAYGTNGTGPIPGNATLLFEIKLLNVQ